MLQKNWQALIKPKQLAVERSLVNEFFTTGYTQGVGAIWQGDMFKLQGMINDGTRAGEKGGAETFAPAGDQTQQRVARVRDGGISEKAPDIRLRKRNEIAEEDRKRRQNRHNLRRDKPPKH